MPASNSMANHTIVAEKFQPQFHNATFFLCLFIMTGNCVNHNVCELCCSWSHKILPNLNTKNFSQFQIATLKTFTLYLNLSKHQTNVSVTPTHLSIAGIIFTCSFTWKDTNSKLYMIFIKLFYPSILILYFILWKINWNFSACHRKEGDLVFHSFRILPKLRNTNHSVVFVLFPTIINEKNSAVHAGFFFIAMPYLQFSQI